MLNTNEVSNRSSAIEAAIKTAARLEYSTLSALSNSKDGVEFSALEKEVNESNLISSDLDSLTSDFDYAFIPAQNSSYDVSAEYLAAPTRNSSVSPEYEAHSDSTISEVKTEMMTPLEYTEALMDTQYAAIAGAWSDVSYEQRVRMTNFFTYDKALARAFHDMDCLTRDINFKVI